MPPNHSSAFRDFLRSGLSWAYKRPAQDTSDIPLGKSEDELERQLLHHWCMTQGFGSKTMAPVQDILNAPGAKVLDIGCGSGVWIMEMAADFPQASFVGVDNDSYALPNSTMPSNVEFELADVINQKLPFADESFDFIHLRAMSTIISGDEWPALLKDIWRVLKPGGFLEDMEIDKSTDCTPEAVYANKWESAFILALRERKGIDWYRIRHLPELLPTLGAWTVVSTNSVAIPSGRNGGELAQLMRQDFWHIFEASLRFGGTTDEEKIQEYAKKISEEFNTWEMSTLFTSVVARKSQA